MPPWEHSPTARHLLPSLGAELARRLYGVDMRTLYMVTSGSADPTRASVPLHLAVNGSLEVGHTVGVVLAGDATELLKEDVCQSLEGLGVPPMRDLLAKARQHDVPVYV
jgi:predicted peroxiredoxin